LFGVWWAGAEPDVKDVGANAKGYSALALNPNGTEYPLMQDLLKKVHDAGQGSGPRDEVGSVLYTRGMIISMLSVEAVRAAMEELDRKSTRLNSSHVKISYAVFCLKKKKQF